MTDCYHLYKQNYIDRDFKRYLKPGRLLRRVNNSQRA